MRFVFGLRGRRLAVLSTAMFALGGGVAVSTAAILTTGTATSVIQACMLKGVGTIRIVSDASKCNDKFETPISWNVVGPQGLPGKDGLNGAPGPKGNTGAAGTNGTNGTNGLPGATGAPGKDGANGADGQPCLPSNPLCVGPKGDPGAQGPPGPQGPAGSASGLASFDAVNGLPCNLGGGLAGTISTAYAPNTEVVTLTCTPTALHTLSVTVGGDGSGTVTGSGISCPPTCSKDFTAGVAVTLTATPSGQDGFTGWTGACTGTAPTCTVTMNADTSVGASFVARQLLTVESISTTYHTCQPLVGCSDYDAAGTVTSVPTAFNCDSSPFTNLCSAGFPTGSTVTLTATLGANATAAGWAGCDTVTTSNACVVTVSGARTVSVTFTQ
jgi:hypothetical protein